MNYEVLQWGRGGGGGGRSHILKRAPSYVLMLVSFLYLARPTLPTWPQRQTLLATSCDDRRNGPNPARPFSQSLKLCGILQTIRTRLDAVSRVRNEAR